VLRDPALRLVPEHQIAPDAFLHATTGGHDVLEKSRLFNNFKLARFAIVQLVRRLNERPILKLKILI
jgi:hypothetical protein